MRNVLIVIIALALSAVPAAYAQDKPSAKNESGIMILQGGKSFSGAVEIVPGKFRLGHPLKPNEHDYFRIKIVSGQKLICGVRTMGPADQAGVSIYSAEQNEVARTVAYGINNYRTCFYQLYDLPGIGQNVYVLVGSEYAANTNTLYDVRIQNNFDRFSAQDAGAEFSTALEITPGENAFLSYAPENDIDMYMMIFKSGNTATFTLKPGQEAGYFRLTLYNGRMEQIAIQKNKAPGKEVIISIVNDGPDEKLYIKVDRDYQGDPDGEYTLKADIK
jgi:hypothetical protein